MTIAFGILASDGLVIAADQQVTIQNYWKGEHGKIWMSEHTGIGPDGACVLAGATSRVGYLESLGQQLVGSFLDHKEAVESVDVRQLFSTVIVDFHREHVVPYHDLPEVNLVIGYQRDYRGGFWSTSRAAVTEHPDYAAVGVGGPTASTLLRRYWRHERFDVAAASALAVFVALHVKETVDGCGAVTDVTYLRSNRFGRVPPTTVTALEAAFREYVTRYQPSVLWDLFGVPGDEKPPQSIESLGTTVRELIAQIRNP